MFAWLFLVANAAQAIDRVIVQLDRDASQQAVSGRLFVFFSQQNQIEPRRGPNWFKPEPFFARDVKDLQPGKYATIDASADACPAPLDKLPAGTYHIQAALHVDFDSPSSGVGVGNFFGEVLTADITEGSGTLELSLNQIVPAPKFAEKPWLKEVAVRSELLSKFHRREVIQYASVVLPESYEKDSDRRYPVIYSIPGFGGSHREVIALTGPVPVDENGVEFIRVFLSGRCLWGHHVYADSATNGPRGQALIAELIPHVDRTFRTVAASTARFVTGHSSGGWSSLWLQVTYPDVFGGVWSLAPDPVDFRDYQQVDLYASPPQNMYRDPRGERRPIARRGGQPVLWYDAFTKMDDTIGRGGQLRSFEAVFSPLDANGEPRRMYDRVTGQVDPQVAKAWEAYDIRLTLARNWPQLGPKLAGKLHIVAGEFDTFYLEGATKLLGETLKELDSDAQVEVIAGADHSSFLTSEFRARLRREMGEQFLKHHAK
ncbi:MAG: hypothetical protein JNM18_00760 [Planctomycetaceae bacterium]|nr:hypothetical protein [Planctomycetaceae bacterium]